MKFKAFYIFVLIIGLTVPVFSETWQKYAVIDVQQVTSSSKSVAKITREHNKDKKNLIKFVKESVSKLNKEKDKTKKEEMRVKLGEEIQSRKESMDAKYSAKLMEIDKQINSRLADLAKEKGYTLILVKDAVLYGGDNLTDEMVKLAK
jgi:Skp family chaperone for outer membrane proteins